MSWQNEKAYKLDVKAALEARGYVMQMHEDKYENFIADLSMSGNFVDGWIEVKYCKRTPVKLASIKHYTMGQRNWLVQRGRAGSGHCYLLVGTPTLHLLIPWKELHVASEVLWKDLPNLAAVVAKDLRWLVRGFADRVRIRSH